MGEAIEALAACHAVLDAAAGDVPAPQALKPAGMGSAAQALKAPPCETYRAALAGYRRACADHHARPVLALVDTLLETFASAYAEAKAARAAVDFDDLELGVRDLLAGVPAVRRRWRERFELIMVDEFQDTNRLQLGVLETLERDNLFAVGDEFQSIYGFRHADVGIFRERRAAGRVRSLRTNFRSPEELLDGLNAAFAPVFGPRFAPLLAGRPAVAEPAAADGPLRLFDPDGDPRAGTPPVELLLTHHEGWEEAGVEPGLAGQDAPTPRRVEARGLAHRLRAEVDAGRRPGEIVVLVRAAGSLRLLEQALEEQGLPTYVVGGRGYWSQEQVRDGLAYLGALSNPRDEPAFYGVLASPFCGVGADALVLLARAARAAGGGPWAALRAAPAAAPDWLAEVPGPDRERLLAFASFFAAERGEAERLGGDVLLERAVAHTGYDLAILARSGGERRLANLRKLMRLAREYELAEGHDLRAFLAYAATQDLAQAREGEAPIESEGLDAVRLMTMHRAKGLEFPVVCVADLGRRGDNRAPRLLLGRDGTVGLRLVSLGEAGADAALAYDAIAEAVAEEEAAEERRLLYVAMTRARERLIVSGTTDLTRWEPPRPSSPPIDWLAPALLGDPAAALDPGRGAERVLERDWEGRPARLALRVHRPGQHAGVLPPGALAPAARPRASAPGTALPAAPKVVPVAPRGRPAPQRLSYTALQAYQRCPYRSYLERVLRLPARSAAAAGGGGRRASRELDPRLRGTLAHLLLERLDFARPELPGTDAVAALGAELGVQLDAAEVEDLRALVAAFAGAPLRERLAAAHDVRREASFAFALDPDGTGPLVVGFLDVLAREPGDAVLVVDYKSDRLEGAEPEAVVDAGYATQRAVYALAALRGGAASVEVAHCFLERPAEPVVARFGPADASALGAEVARLAGGLLAERWPVTAEPHRELCGDCPGRRSLCSHPESMTLRERPA